MDRKLIPLKDDHYRKTRGGYARLLDISCTNCGNHVCFYQKDGPGEMKRMYLDRIIDYSHEGAQFVCLKCKQILGMKSVYEKEKRPIYRMFVGATNKKIVKSHS